jgi:hypothetical protein
MFRSQSIPTSLASLNDTVRPTLQARGDRSLLTETAAAHLSGEHYSEESSCRGAGRSVLRSDTLRLMNPRMVTFFFKGRIVTPAVMAAGGLTRWNVEVTVSLRLEKGDFTDSFPLFAECRAL